MHAFVRFRKVGERYVAWYRPDHRIVPLAAPFFAERFPSMEWSILTPDLSVHWNGRTLSFSEGVARDAAPSEDELEELWRTYYASIFNPARTNVAKMRADMPSRFWRDLPELRDVPRMLANASTRVGSMIEVQRSVVTAAAFVPRADDLDALRAALPSCEGCELARDATRPVFGEGPPRARVMLIGEQPGDVEERVGRPFAGPAGELLDRAMNDAGLARQEIYVTNAVKHFAHIERGKQRIHRTPRMIEVTACRPWLDAELRVVNPELIIAAGATAARALLGARVRILRDRGTFFTMRDGRLVIPTLHPAAILRADVALRDIHYAQLVTDLRAAGERARQLR
jgi:DNA polymerase